MMSAAYVVWGLLELDPSHSIRAAPARRFPPTIVPGRQITVAEYRRVTPPQEHRSVPAEAEVALARNLRFRR
jgi:hypothetical protein